MDAIRLDEAEMERVACDLCGGVDHRLLETRSRFGIPLNTVICTGCGHVFHNPRMSEKRYHQFYERDYRHLMGESQFDLEAFFQLQVAHGRRVLEFCRDALPRGGRVLDVGCGTGGQLHVFAVEHGCEVVGIEPGEREARFARTEKDLRVFEGVLENIDLEPASFDLVIMTQVLNHLLRPRTGLERVRNLLKADGALFIEVQDFVHLLHTRPFRRATTIDHPNMLHPATLRPLLRRVGFEPLREHWDRNGLEHDLEAGLPSRHMRVCARRSAPDAATPWADWRATVAEIRRNQRHYRLRVSPKHYVAVGLQRVLGAKGYSALRALYRGLVRR